MYYFFRNLKKLRHLVELAEWSELDRSRGPLDGASGGISGPPDLR